MILGTTFYLAGLTAMIVPIIIHLWSRKTRKTIAFGTTKFLEENDTQTIKNPVPTEWWLLLLRVLIIVCLVIILSDPWRKSEPTPTSWTLVDPQYIGHPDLANLLESGKGEVRWLSPGFPAFADSTHLAIGSYWDLLEGLAQEEFEDLVIISPRRIKNFQGIRKAYPLVSWVSLPVSVQTFEWGHFSSAAGQYTITGVSDEQSTIFHQARQTKPIIDSLQVSVAIHVDEYHQELKRFLEASVEVINENSPLSIKLVDDQKADWLIWLSKEPVPARPKLLMATDQKSVNKIFRISNDVYGLSAYDVEGYLTYNFPLHFERTLGADFLDSQTDLRLLPEYQLPEASHVVKSRVLEKEYISDWFWVLLLGLLLLERYGSLKKTSAA